MEALELARWQFGITTVYHFIFVPITLGLALLVAIMQTFHYRTGKEVYDEMARFWGKLFVINFTLGLVTGIVQEFQFGMNWSEYSRFVGDIFGIPLAIEALVAFFLESTFLGLWLFGRGRIPQKLHLFSIWMVAIGANLSALFILMANSWMQSPVGFVLRNDRAELADFVAIMLNDRFLAQAPHVLVAGAITGGLFVLGISCWHLLRKHRVDIFSRSAKIALVFTAVASIAAATTGHSQAQQTADLQPMKLAAMEGVWETEQPASMSLFAIHDVENRESRREIEVPYLLSILAHNDSTTEVRGMKELQQEAEEKYGEGDYIPPVTIVYWAFRIMVGLGMAFIFFSLAGLVLWWLGKLEKARWFHWLGISMIFLPFFANTAGWTVTEMGRQPWVVYGLLLTEDGVSPAVAEASVWTTVGGFTVLYGILAAVHFALIYKFARPNSSDGDDDDADRSLPGLGDNHAY